MNHADTIAQINDLHAQADALVAKADILYSSLLAPSMREADLREQAETLRSQALDLMIAGTRASLETS